MKEEILTELISKDDESLVAYFNQNSSDVVLGIIYDRYEKRIFFKAKSITKNDQVAKDLTHDIFIKIFTKLHQFKGNSAFSLWVHSITVNTCLSYLGNEKKSPLYELDQSKFDPPSSADEELERKMIEEIKIERLAKLLHLMDPNDKMILIMKYTDDMSINSISDILKTSLSATKMRLKRAREKLYNSYLINFEDE